MGKNMEKPNVMIRLVSCIIILLILGFSNAHRFGWDSIPADFPKPLYDFSKNPYKPAVLALGRNLFYDPRLSADSTISCASCHSPYNAFAHTDHALSHGIYDSIGFRNAPALFNLAWHPSMMWDGAIHHLDLQALAPLQAKNEMASNLNTVLKNINSNNWYKKQVERAFGDSVIHGEQLLKALAQFQLSLISNQSRYDSMRRKQIQFNAQEKKGYAIFKLRCQHCHREPLFSSFEFARNGISFNTSLNDVGRSRVTQQNIDSGLFKIPSLRNLSFTFPYMHDGRFKTLREVIQHYAEHGAKANLPMNFSPSEKTDLIAFLLTLNDRHFIFDTTHTFPKELRKELEGN